MEQKNPDHPQKLLDHVKDERKFLHDMSNQLLIAQGMGGFVLKMMKNRIDADEKEVERLEKSVRATNKMVDMIRDRRAYLHSIFSD